MEKKRRAARLGEIGAQIRAHVLSMPASVLPVTPCTSLFEEWPDVQQLVGGTSNIDDLMPAFQSSITLRIIQAEEAAIVKLHEDFLVTRCSLASSFDSEELFPVLAFDVPFVSMSPLSRNYTTAERQRHLNLESVVFLSGSGCDCCGHVVPWRTAISHGGIDIHTSRAHMVAWWSLLRSTGLREDTSNVIQKLQERGRNSVCTTCLQELEYESESTEAASRASAAPTEGIQAFDYEDIVRHIVSVHWLPEHDSLYGIEQVGRDDSIVESDTGFIARIFRSSIDPDSDSDHDSHNERDSESDGDTRDSVGDSE
ncbi:hypothetical protein ACM66B_006615 [Microbotryomycetes sp. NB124-2]